jgi:DNA mismatch repair protein MutH
MKSYESATTTEILRRAKEIIGLTINELSPIELPKSKSLNKGEIGNLIQLYGFGIRPNSLAEPDFRGESIELKIIPLTKGANGYLRVKERTKVGMINYETLAKEKWESSHAKHKLSKILFIPIEHNYYDARNSKILDAFLYQVEDVEEYSTIKDDWERTKKLVSEGKAHSLSESQNKILSPSRTGSGGEKDWVSQPYSSEKALRRAFSLKQSYTNLVIKTRQNGDNIIKLSDEKAYRGKNILSTILNKLSKWEGKTLFEFIHAENITLGGGKNRNVTLIRHLLGLKSKGTIKEFEEIGLTIKVTPRNLETNRAYEQMSFPHQPFASIIEEDDFEESQLRTYLQNFIFIPLLSSKKSEKDPKKISFGKPVLWTPNEKELSEIREEWGHYRDTLRAGLTFTTKKLNSKKGFITKTNLPKKSDTTWIHMRPHARDSSDVDKSVDFNGKYCVKMSFWLNQ